MKLSPILLALAALASPGTTSAAWLPDGNLVVEGSWTREGPVVVSDGAGGAIFAWSNARNIHAQRLTASGGYLPGWTSLGIAVSTAEDDQYLVGAIVDGNGGAYLVWEDYRDFATNREDVYLHHVLAEGTLAPGWPANGLAVAALAGSQRYARLASDGAGGVYVTWADESITSSVSDVYLQHFTPVGAVASGWPVDGLLLCSAPGFQGHPAIAPDGAGGVYVAWEDERAPNGSSWDIYVTRIGPDASRAPGWPADGAPVCTASGGQGACEVTVDGAGGVYVGWFDARSAPNLQVDPTPYLDIYVQRMTASGTVASGWPANGLPICTAPQIQHFHQLAPDGAGGLYLAWQDNRFSDYDVYLQHVRPDATLAPGWPVNGMRPLPSLLGFQLHPHLAPDGAGGVYLSIDNLTSGYSVHTQHVTGNGALAPGWPDFGQPATSVHTDEDESQIAPDGFGGAIVVWVDYRNQGDDLFAKRLQPLGPTATLVSLQSATAEPGLARLAWLVTGISSLRATVERRTEATEWATLGSVIADGTGRLAYEDATVEAGQRYAYRLRFPDGDSETTTPEAWLDIPVRFELALAGLRPNPATRGDLTVAFTLPDASPARLELLDVSGRRVASRAIGMLGAGRHTVRLDEERAIAAGVYWVRLVHSSGTLAAKTVIAD